MAAARDVTMAGRAREDGNLKFKNGDFYEALCSYNQSLLHAKKADSSELLALGFANRSAVYLKVRQYEKCLKNIKLAKEHGYAVDVTKLDAREKQCEEKLEIERPDADLNPRNFFNLSYPANERIPFIVNCLEMREVEKYDRGIYTTQDLKPGDVVSVEEALFFDLYGSVGRCTNCSKGNMLSLLPSRYAGELSSFLTIFNNFS